MLCNEIIRAAIPNASDETCDYVLWSRTPFPCGMVTAKSLYRAASRIRRCGANGIRLCDCCDNMVEKGKYLCQKCDEALHQPYLSEETKKAPPGIPNEA